MTKRELIRAEINLKSRWSQAIYQQQLAKEKPERKEIAEEAANVALGYMYAIADILQVTKGVSNADRHFYLRLVNNETVEVIDLASGSKRYINIACDNAAAMMYDIFRQADDRECKPRGITCHGQKPRLRRSPRTRALKRN